MNTKNYTDKAVYNSTKESRQKISRAALMFARIVFVPLTMFIAGWGLFPFAANLLEFTYEQYLHLYTAARFGTALLFGVIMIFLTVPILNLLYFVSNRIEKLLSKFSGKELLMGIVGLVVGIVLAVVFGILLNMIIAERSIVYVSTIFFIVIFAFVGMRVGANLMSDVWAPATNTTKAISEIRSANDVKILDSSALIDGRILDIVRTGFISGLLLIPDFILTELSKIADCDDMLKKNRGRRGLEIAAELQKEKGVVIEVDRSITDDSETDAKLISLAGLRGGKIITVDFNLNKLAAARSIEALNVNDLSNAIKPIALPGENMRLKVVKEGKEHGQGVAYSPDGTMIVIENGGGFIGKEVDVTVMTSLQTSAGRIIFTRIF